MIFQELFVVVHFFLQEGEFIYLFIIVIVIVIIITIITLIIIYSADLETYYQEPDLSSVRPSVLVHRQEGDIKKWEERCRSVCRGLQYCTCNLFGGSGIAEDLDAGIK